MKCLTSCLKGKIQFLLVSGPLTVKQDEDEVMVGVVVVAKLSTKHEDLLLNISQSPHLHTKKD